VLQSGVQNHEHHKILSWVENLVQKPDIHEISISLYDDTNKADKGFFNEVFYDNMDPKWKNIDQKTKDRLWGGKLPWERIFNKGPWLDDMVTTYKGFYNMVNK
jgi:hypothetical protein